MSVTLINLSLFKILEFNEEANKQKDIEYFKTKVNSAYNNSNLDIDHNNTTISKKLAGIKITITKQMYHYHKLLMLSVSFDKCQCTVAYHR